MIRAHGSTVTANPVPPAVHAGSIARCHRQPGSLGEVIDPTAAEARPCTELGEGQLHPSWDLWTPEAAKPRSA